MSAKQAKRERQAQRRRGEIPRVDAKRAAREAQYVEIERQRAAAAKFRREHPEEYAAQQRRSAERVQALINAIGIIGLPRGIF